MRSRVYKTVRCPSVRQSVCPISRTQQSRAAGLLLSAVRAKYIDRQRRAPGSSSAAARGRSTALSSKCGQCHVDSRINEAEHRLGLLSILGLLKFQQCSLLVWNLCPDGNVHGIIYRHIGWTGLAWIDEHKSPVFHCGKSGNPILHARRYASASTSKRPRVFLYLSFDHKSARSIKRN